MLTLDCVLFDLDGTLLDTAPDMGRALNRLLREQGRQPLAHRDIRPVVSHGSPGLLELGFSLYPDDADYPPLRDRFLALYRDCLARDTRPFPGIPELLDWLEGRDIPWGVVTNKPGWLTEPLLAALDLTRRAACIVSGDTLPQRKPHPAPLLHACGQIGVAPDHCVYVGDAERDVEAGKRAGMRTVAATWGYIPEEDDPAHWQADALLEDAWALARWLNRADALPGVA
jgi:phosphoglycolate phosphatase